MKVDVLVLGGGPAGLAAALSAKGRNRSVLCIGNPWEENPLAKAELVDNYLGITKVTGKEMMETFVSHCDQWEIERVTGRVVSAMAFHGFALTVGQEVYQGRSLILATGVARGVAYEGEERLLGKGVSYCATCDGFLYKSKSVVVVGLASEAPSDAKFLHGLGCQVTYVAHKKPEDLESGIHFVKMGKLIIHGEEKVSGITVGDTEITCEGVFLLRAAMAPTALFPSLETEQGYITVNRKMETNISGLFAAGDCTGLPLQVAKAVGEGHIAGISASEWLDEQDKVET